MAFIIRKFGGLFAAAMIAGLFNISLASAATFIFSDKSEFTPVAGASVTDDYENANYSLVNNNTAMSAVLGETTYTSTGFANQNIINSSNGDKIYCAGCNGSFLLDFTSTSVGTSSGVSGVSMDYFNPSVLFSYTAFVTFGDGSTANYGLDTVSLSAFDGFWGITSDLLISSIAFGHIDGGTTKDGFFGIDNLTIGQHLFDEPPLSAVPLPAALPLYGAGMALMGFIGWRKRRAG